MSLKKLPKDSSIVTTYPTELKIPPTYVYIGAVVKPI